MEKCKTKLVPKLVDKQMKFTRKIVDNMLKKRIANLEKEYSKEPRADLEKEIKNLKKKMKTKKEDTKIEKQLIKSLTDAFCNPGCKGTIFQEGDFDVESYVKDTICKKKDKTRDCKNMVKLIKKSRKTIVKDRKRILDDDSFYYAFVNKTKKAQLIKDGAVSGCAVMSLV
jgi:DNA gyrase/topoisomerase IV subunit A